MTSPRPSTPPNRALLWTFPVLVFSTYVNFKDMYSKAFGAGVEYNIIYRDLKELRRVSEATKRETRWVDIQKARNDAERKASMSIPDFVHSYVKRQMKAEREEKKN